MNNLNINQSGVNNNDYGGTVQNTPYIQKQTQQIIDQQVQTESTAQLTVGNQKIPSNPVLNSNPSAQQSTSNNSTSSQIVAINLDGSVITQSSGTSSPVNALDTSTLAYSGIQTQQESPSGPGNSAGPVTGQSTSKGQFEQSIQNTIQNLQQDLNNNTSSSQTEMSSGGVSSSPFLTSYLTLSQQDPTAADMVLLQVQLEELQLGVTASGSNTTINLSLNPNITAALTQYGIQPPTGKSDWNNLTASDLKQLSTNLNTQITQQTNSLGLAGKNLAALLGTSVFGMIPLEERGAPIFDLLHARNELLAAGFTSGANPTLDNQILSQLPSTTVQLLQDWYLIPGSEGNVTSNQLASVVPNIESYCQIDASTTKIDSTDLMNARALGSYPMQDQQTQDFLNLIDPTTGGASSILQQSGASSMLSGTTLSQGAQNAVQSLVSGILSSGLVNSSVSSGSSSGSTNLSIINAVESAMATLVGSGQAGELAGVFSATQIGTDLDATGKTHPEYQGKVHTGSLNSTEQEMLQDMSNMEYAENWNGQGPLLAYKSGNTDIGTFLENYYSTQPQGFQQPTTQCSINTLNQFMNDLTQINPAQLPEVYDFISARPWLQAAFPQAATLIKNEPQVSDDPVPVVGFNPGDNIPGQNEQGPMIQASITVLEKILSEVKSGTISLTEAEAKIATLPQSIGLSDTFSTSQIIQG